MKRLILVLLTITTISLSSKAQQNTSSEYKTAIGVKIYPAAFTIKHFVAENRAVEGLAYFWNYGTRATGLYEFHGDIPGVDGLKWYAGPGVHIGFWSNKWKKDYPNRDAGIAIGIDGIGGLDYKFKGVPINIFVDWQPSFNFVGYNYFEAGWGGTGIRYTF